MRKMISLTNLFLTITNICVIIYNQKEGILWPIILWLKKRKESIHH